MQRTLLTILTILFVSITALFWGNIAHTGTPVFPASPTLQTSDVDISMPVCGVYPNSPYYAAIVSLVERYGIDVSAADGTCRADKPLTVGEFALHLESAMRTVEQLLEMKEETPAR